MNDHTYTTHLCLTQKEMDATAADMLVMIAGLGSNILKNLGNVELGKSVRLFLHDKQNKTIGGIAGDIFGGWIYISLLWVDETCRNRGYGTELVNRLESEAIQLGCKYAHVDTYSFEAKPLYERLGYKVFARLEDYPPGHCKYFLKKTLAVNATAIKGVEKYEISSSQNQPQDDSRPEYAREISQQLNR